ncbi:MAG: translocation/assembly module TamB domain-containing protein [Chromatiales bacterium]|nr:translocation/assembly module TamB domain-containing protein [Chromatiales bacterium]
MIGLFLRLFVKAVLRVAAAAIATLLMLALLLVLVLGSPPGTAFLLEALEEATDGMIRAERSEGSLLGGLRVERLLVTTEAVGVEVLGVSLEAFWPDLLRGRVTLTTARADRVNLALRTEGRDDDAPAEPLPDSISLPIGLVAQSLEVARLAISAGDFSQEIEALSLSGRWIGDQLSIERITARAADVSVIATGEARLGLPFPLDLEIQWNAPALDLSGGGRVAGDLDELRIQQSVQVPEPVRIQASLVSLLEAPGFDLLVDWRALERALPGIGELRSRGGWLRASGTPEAYSLLASAGLVLDEWPGLEIVVEASGDTRELQLDALRLALLGGSALLTGRVGLQDPFAGQLNFSFRGIDPSGLLPEWPGRLDAEGDLTFNAAGDFTVGMTELGGTLRGQAFSGSGVIARLGDDWRVRETELRMGDNRLALDGRWTAQRAEADFSLDAPDLGLLWPGLSGQLAGAGTLAGTAALPELVLELSGRELALDGQRIGELQLRGSLASDGQIALDLRADGLSSGELELGLLEGSLAGRVDDHRWTLGLAGEPLALEMDGSGSFRDGQLRQLLESARLVDPLGQPWVLEGAPEFQLAERAGGLDAHCWRSGEASACLGTLSFDGDDFELAASLRELPVALLAALLAPEDLVVTGLAVADLRLARRDGGFSGRFSWRQQDTSISYMLAEGEEIGTSLPQLVLDLNLQDDEARFVVAMATEVGLRATLGGRVLDLDSASPRIEAAVIGDLPDLGQLAPFILRFADIGELEGRASLEATLSGDLRRPVVAGGLRLREGRLSVPATGIVVEQVSLDLIGRGAGGLELTGSAVSGSGQVTLDGALGWDEALVVTGEIAVQGENFQVIRLPDVQVQVSPDLQVRLVEGQFRATGRVLVPLAQIRLREIPADVPRPSPDVVVHRTDQEAVGAAAQPLLVLERLEVDLGSRVALRGFGLETSLAGRMVLSQSLRANGAGPLTADGIITLEQGSFTALGKRLRIDRGALIFSGLIDNPGLDVRTSRTVTWENRDVTVGLLLGGTLREIETRIFSEPAMSELDALSFLTLDRPISAAGAGEGADLTGAAISLGLRQALPVAQRLGSALGLDEVGLEGGELEETQIVAGRQLGSDLYVRYAFGLFNRIGTIKLVYRITRRFSVEASSGENQALTLLYSVEW